jgi:hypothetical protein
MPTRRYSNINEGTEAGAVDVIGSVDAGAGKRGKKENGQIDDNGWGVGSMKGGTCLGQEL